MSDQQAPTTVDTPAVAGPTEAPGTAQDQPQGSDWQKRYTDLQAEYTRSQQASKEAQEREQWYQALVTSDDPDTRRQAAEILGFELPDDEQVDEGFEPDGYEDPTEQLRAELEELKAWKDSLTQNERQQVEQEFTSAYAHEQLDELGVDPEDTETRRLVFERALSLPRLRPLPGMPVDGLVDMKSAYEQITAYQTSMFDRWRKTKRAPFVPPGGQSANEVPDPGTGPQARMNRAMLRLRNDLGDD